MMDRARHGTAKNKKRDRDAFSKGILDVIEDEYNDRYVIILEDYNRLITMFSGVEWLNILTKSRNSHKRDIK